MDEKSRAEVLAVGVGSGQNPSASVAPVKKKPKAAPPVPIYSGGEALEKLSPGVSKARAAVTPAQEIFQKHGFSAIEDAVVWFKENKHNLKPSELHKWFTFFAKHESPEIKAIEGQAHTDANIQINLTTFNFNNASPEEIALKGKKGVPIEVAAETIGKPSDVSGDTGA